MILRDTQIGRLLVARRHTALLFALIAMFAMRPFLGSTGAAAVGFSLAILAVLFVALLTIHIDDLVGDPHALDVQRRRRRLFGWALAVPAFVERVWMFFSPTPQLVEAGVISWLVFFCYVTWSQLRSLLKQREVTSETISKAISIYLLLGLCWGILFILIHLRHPEAFNLGPDAGLDEVHVFPILLYFSMTTLSTIGFGDITPVSLAARYAAVAEGISGQFYLAILVARLVGMQMSGAAAASTRQEPQRNVSETPRSAQEKGDET